MLPVKSCSVKLVVGGVEREVTEVRTIVNVPDAGDVSVGNDFSVKTKLKEALSYTGTQVQSLNRIGKDSIFHDNAGLDKIIDMQVQSLFGGKDNVIRADSSQDTTTKEILSFPVYETVSDEDLTKKNGARCEHDNVILQSKKGEVISNGDETDSLNNAASIIEELVLQRESMRDSTKPQKNNRSTLKPLKLAEEAEKKQTFTSIHLEEGASAQPMRLDGIYWSSTTTVSFRSQF